MIFIFLNPLDFKWKITLFCHPKKNGPQGALCENYHTMMPATYMDSIVSFFNDQTKHLVVVVSNSTTMNSSRHKVAVQRMIVQ
jgi:hypothetical protein